MPDLGNMPEPIAHSATSDTPAIEPAAPAAPEPASNAPAPEAQGSTPAAETPAAEGAAGEAGEEGAGQEAAPVETPAPKKNPFGERLSQMAADRRAAEERQRAAEARADKLADLLEKTLTGLAPQQRQQEREEQQNDPRPQRDQFADPDAYDDALIEWSTRSATRVATAEFDKRQAAERERESREQQQSAQRQQFEAARDRYAKARDELLTDPQYADYSEVAENPALNITETMLPALLEVDNGPKVLYHLGQNPQEADRIAALSPTRQFIEIGRISASLETQSRPPVRRPPPQVEPVGSRAPAGPKDPDEMSTEEYAATRMPKLQAERRAGMWGRPPH